MVLVNLTAATICFLGQCYPALVGKNTPVGEFQLTPRITQKAGYGGDVLQFLEKEYSVYAIHRVYLLNPAQRRAERLKSDDPADRLITNGCINIDPKVYDKLMECCSHSTLTVVR